MISKHIYSLYLLLIITPFVTSQDNDDTFSINPNNTKIEFKAKHFGVINVSGTFKDFQGQLQVRDDIIVSAKISLNVKSITTHNNSRDKSLKHKEFLDAVSHPFITLYFQNNYSSALIESEVKVKAATNPVPINYKVSQINDTTGIIEANLEISRRDFLLDLGSMNELVSDKVQVTVLVVLKLK